MYIYVRYIICMYFNFFLYNVYVYLLIFNCICIIYSYSMYFWFLDSLVREINFIIFIIIMFYKSYNVKL